MNQLPQDICHKISLYNSHPCADLIRNLKSKLESSYSYLTNDSFKDFILIHYSCSRYHTTGTMAYHKVLQELKHLFQHARARRCGCERLLYNLRMKDNSDDETSTER